MSFKNRKAQRIVAVILTLAMIFSLFPAGAFAATAAPDVKTGTATVNMLHEQKEQPSMCNIMFDSQADIEVTGDEATLKLYVANPVPAFADQGKDGTVKNVVVNYDGQQYPAVSELGTGKMMTARDTNKTFGFEQGKQYAAQVLTIKLPAAAVAEGAKLKTNAFVNVVMMTDVVFRIGLTDVILTDPNAEAAAAVDEKIAAIGEVTLESENTIIEARAAYDGLTAEQQKLVKNLAVLEAAEASLLKLKNTAPLEPGFYKVPIIGLNSAAPLEPVAVAFNTGFGTEAQVEVKANGSKIITLTPRHMEIDLMGTIFQCNVLKLKSNGIEATYPDGVKSESFSNQDGSLGTINCPVTIATELPSYAETGEIGYPMEVTVDFMNGMYGDVNKDNWMNVQLLLDFTKAEKYVPVDPDTTAAAAVDEKIAAIGEVTLESEKAITDARTAYDGLTAEQKALVKNLAVLEAAENKLVELKNPGVKMFAVEFTNGDHGKVTASYYENGVKKILKSGDKVPEGTSVEFAAVADKDYKVVDWHWLGGGQATRPLGIETIYIVANYTYIREVYPIYELKVDRTELDKVIAEADKILADKINYANDRMWQHLERDTARAKDPKYVTEQAQAIEYIENITSWMDFVKKLDKTALETKLNELKTCGYEDKAEAVKAPVVAAIAKADPYFVDKQAASQKEIDDLTAELTTVLENYKKATAVKMFAVNFSDEDKVFGSGKHGTLTVTAHYKDGRDIVLKTGDKVPEGTEVEFKLKLDDNYKLERWHWIGGGANRTPWVKEQLFIKAEMTDIRDLYPVYALKVDRTELDKAIAKADAVIADKINYANDTDWLGLVSTVKNAKDPNYITDQEDADNYTGFVNDCVEFVTKLDKVALKEQLDALKACGYEDKAEAVKAPVVAAIAKADPYFVDKQAASQKEIDDLTAELTTVLENYKKATAVKMFAVNFSDEDKVFGSGKHGTLTVTAHYKDGRDIVLKTGDKVPEGTEVEFKLKLDDNYKLERWHWIGGGANRTPWVKEQLFIKAEMTDIRDLYPVYALKVDRTELDKAIAKADAVIADKINYANDTDWLGLVSTVKNAKDPNYITDQEDADNYTGFVNDCVEFVTKLDKVALKEQLDALKACGYEDKAEAVKAPVVAAIAKADPYFVDKQAKSQKEIDDLTAELTTVLENYKKALNEAADKAAAKAVVEKINAIGKVTLESEKAITDARTAYDALTETQKALVDNLATLEAAEKTLAALKAEAADKAAAKAVEEQIKAIGKVTADSEQAITDARKAYDALTDAQKELVKNLSDLEKAEREFGDLNTKVTEEKVTMLNATKNQNSMCDIMFDKNMGVRANKDGKTVDLILYVANPVPGFADQGKDGTVKNVVLTYNGKTYAAVSELKTGAKMTAKDTNQVFGFTAGNQYDAQVLTFENLPKEVLKEWTVKINAYVNVVMMTDVEFRLQLDKNAPVVDAPVIEPKGGEFTDNIEVVIKAAKDAVVYYTLDGKAPTVNSTKYTDKIKLTETTTVKAIAVQDGIASSVAEATFTKSSGGSGGGGGFFPMPEEGCFLEDGNYYVGIELWHETDNKESMGGAAFQNNDKALVTVKNGIVTNVQIATNPVDVGPVHSAITDIHSDVVNIKVLEKGNLTTEPAGKKYQYVKRASFVMPNTSEYQPADSKVITYIPVGFTVPDTPMDAVPEIQESGLNARLKITWSTATATKDSTLAQDPTDGKGETADGEVIEDVVRTDKATGIQLNATTEEVSKDAAFKVVTVTNGNKFEAAKKALANVKGSWKLYDINVVENGSAVATNGPVTLSVPCKNDKMAVYRINEDGTKVVIQGKVKNGYYVFNTSRLGLFAVIGELGEAKLPIEQQFPDVTGHWAVNDIAFMVEKGLFKGTSATQFSPNADMTRAMFVSVLARMDGADLSKVGPSNFKDVDPKQWYATSVAWAAENGVVSGTSATTFNPNGVITRQDMASILLRYAEKNKIELKKIKDVTFADENAIDDYAKHSVDVITSAGLLVGMGDNKFVPQATSTRAQVVSMLARFIRNYSL